jgi:uncharacterized membrane protein
MKLPKYTLFALLAAMTMVVIYRDRVLLDPQQWVWRHYQPFKWWLLPHGVTGALALFLGPLQFSRRLRQHHLHRHRLIGRIYVCGVAVAAPVGIVIEAIKYVNGAAPLRLLIGSTGFGILFALTTVVGFSLARRKRIQQHKRWMTRSYAIATVFLQTRCVEQVPWLSRLLDAPGEFLQAHFVSTLWMHIALSLLAAELLLAIDKRRQVRTTSVRSNSARALRTATR